MPPLLARLRSLDTRPDWRRDREDTATLALAAEVAAEAAGWTPDERIEAAALLARARRDAVAMLEALCALAARTHDRGDWVRTELVRIGDRWLNIVSRFEPAEAPARHHRAEAALRALITRRPRYRPAHVALAAVLAASQGPAAAAEHLEAAVAQGAPVRDLWFRMLAAMLDAGPSEPAFRRTRDVPPAPGTADWAVFRLHRAVAFAMAGDAAGTPLPPEDSDIAAALDDALASAAALPPLQAARLLRALAEGRLFRHCPLEEAEAARLRLAEALLALCLSPGTGQEAGWVAIPALGSFLPHTARFWTDAAYRREGARRMVALADRLEEPHRSWQRGKFAFVLEDHALAAEAFADAARAAPEGMGASTYVDQRAVPAIIAARGEMPLLGAAGGTFETVSGAHDPARPTAIVSGNDLYLRRYAVSFAQRLAEVAPGAQMHLHLVGDPAACRADLDRVAAAARGLTLSFSSEPITIDAPYYFASARFLRLGAWMERFGGPVVVTDIDGQWRCDPAQFLAAKMGGADVGLSLSAQVRTGRKAGLGFPVNVYPLPLPWMAVTAWPLAIAPTPGGRRFADLLGRLMDARLRAAAASGARGAWFIDQNVLCAAYMHAARQEPGIAFADLGLPTEIGAPPPPPGLPGPRGRHFIGGG